MICEGLPAYFGDHGHVGTVQPNYGLDDVFGARESYVEFDPDISENLTLEVNAHRIFGRYFRQEYDLKGGKAVGHYSNGAIAAVENRAGSGRTLLMGSFPGAGYFLHHGKETQMLFASFLKMAGVAPRVSIDDTAIQARLHSGRGGRYLWVTNPTTTSRAVRVSLDSQADTFSAAKDLWGDLPIHLEGREIAVNVPARDAAVILLR